MLTQEYEIGMLFKRRPREWIPLPEIMRHAAQYNARIHELRTRKDDPMNIENNKTKINGQWHSWYRYMPEPDLFGAETYNQHNRVSSNIDF